MQFLFLCNLIGDRVSGKVVTQRPVQIAFWAEVLVVLGGGCFFWCVGVCLFFLGFSLCLCLSE